MDFSLLLTDTEYEQRFKAGHSTPYTFEVLGNGKSIFYFGVRHSRNAEDPQWAQLESYWHKFLETNPGEKAALLEGPGGAVIDGISIEDTTRRFGEVGRLMILSRASHTPITWADLSMQDEIAELSKLFEEKLVKYFIFVRTMGAWLRSGAMGSFDEVVEKAILSTAKRFPSAPPLSFYAETHTQIFGREFSSTEQEILMRAAAPVYHDSIINDIARASSRLRNEHIISEIERNWNSGKSVFVLFGAGHAVIQEKALKTLSTTIKS